MIAKRLKEVFESKPSWVKRQIKKTEAQALAREIRKIKSEAALEIGSASGFSSAVIYSAQAENCENPFLYAFDYSEFCYYDKSRRTGQAFEEIHPGGHNFLMKTGVISAEIERPGHVIDFAFIDADHRTPWPALDLIAIWHYLSSTAVIALHDIEMPFVSQWRDTNGARDLYRSWVGDKHRFDNALNIGFMHNIDEDRMVKSVVASLMMDWERTIAPEMLRKFDDCISRYEPHNQRLLRAAILERKNSAGIKLVRNVKKTTPKVAALPAADGRPINVI
ncbi:class I SAM-dependent methyltransferase [Roseococcus pinisoli]|uniref:Class I SAM-dependent methyltransferase n=1 Tax=Roseococcus pinisoli TaxID=2835040 RepID=A0ABS5QKU9_9PROT|nr:class I SAM-dependent methyltransferase [Roseococcus pinisoli]MBS7813772.1 class I SAM-dependent methyltransferase [Roseococcus pinisoli]